MCEILFRDYLPNRGKWLRKYKVLSFEFEDSNHWYFMLRPIWERIGESQKVDLNDPDRLFAFPKKKQIGKDRDGDPVYEQLAPPKFYESLKSAAEYNKSVRDSGAPDHTDEDRPEW